MVKNNLFYFIFIQKISFLSLWQRKTSWFGTLVFALTLILLFPFALGTDILKRFDISVGVFWAINEFCAALVMGRIFAAEIEGGALDYLISAHPNRALLFLAKVIFNAFILFSLQIPLLFFWIIFFNPASELLSAFLSSFFFLSLAFNLGTSAVGTLITCATIRSLGREILQPLLFFPLQSGLLLASISLCLQSDPAHALSLLQTEAWWTILGFYPVIFIALGCLLSDALFQE